MPTYQKDNSGADTWLIKGLLARNKPTLLYADGGTGKSYVALAIAMSVATGLDILPGLPAVETTGAPVLYLDWEADVEDLADRMEMISKNIPGPDGESWGRGDFNIEYMRCTVPLVHMQEKLKQRVQKTGVQLIVIDSLIPSVDGDATDVETPRKFFQALRTLEVPSLIISHTTKDADANSERVKPFGSAYWWNESRSVWELRKEQTIGDNYSDLALVNRKSNNWKLNDPVGMRMRFDDGVSFESIKLSSQVTSLAKAVPVKTRIMGLLNGNPSGMSVKEIADDIDEPMDTVRHALRRGAGVNFIQEVDQSNNTKTWKIQDDNIITN